MDYEMMDADISNALKEETYLDEQGSAGGYRELIPLLKVLRYKAQHSTNVYESTQEREEGVIYPSYWLR